MTNGEGPNTNADRFARIDAKIDLLIGQTSAFQLDVVQRLTRLEGRADEARSQIADAVVRAKDELAQSAVEARGKVSSEASIARNVVTDEASTKNFFWMRIGIAAAIVSSLVAVGLRLFGK